MAKDKKNTEEKVKEIFETIGITDSFEIIESEELIEVVLNSEDPGMIIGHHGDTLDSLQLMLSLMLAKETGEFKRVQLEVGDYKKNRSDYLRNLAEQTKQRAVEEGREIFLPSLKPWERREVHMYLSEDETVISESVGEGKERTLVVKPR
jgi:spoIIIJ-associated protein